MERENLKMIEKNGVKFFTRPGTSDEWTLEEILDRQIYRKPRRGFIVEREDVWLDAGAYIGEFAVWVMLNGAKGCYSFEPHLESYELTKLNTKVFTNIHVTRAAVGAITGKVCLFVSPKGDHKSNTIFKNLKGLSEETRMVSVHEILKNHTDINSIKLDIEGSEMDIFDSFTDEELKHLRKITAEWHFGYDHSLIRYRKVLERMKQFFPHSSAPEYKKLKDLHTYYPDLAALFFWK